MRTIIYIIFIYLVIERSHEISSQSLPTPVDFLISLLNTTEGDLTDLTNNFTFLGVHGEEVKFFLYTPVETDGDQSKLKYEFIPIEPEEIDLTRPTKIYTHGWVSTIKDDYIKQLAEIYVRRGPFNFIAVYWDKIARKNYLEAASSCKSVGKHVAHLLLRAANGQANFLSNVHLIGHSLGAQISGFAGKEITKRSINGRLTHITALDAAAPLFEFPILMPDTDRITADDADYVESVHTNAGFLGFFAPIGHVDYYVNNGGPMQPGCLGGIITSIACSHMRAHEFYGQSVQDYIDSNGDSKTWLAVNCPDRVKYLTGRCDDNEKALLGEESARYVNGSYYLSTKSGIKILDDLHQQISKIVRSFSSNKTSINDSSSNNTNDQSFSTNNSNGSSLQSNNPNVQIFPSNNPNGQNFPSNNPNVLGFSASHPNVQGYPANNPNGQSFPSNNPNPNSQGFPANNPYVPGFPSNSPNVQGFPANNPNGQNLPSNNPNVLGFSANHPNVQGYPANNPNGQSFPSNNPNVQGYPANNPNGQGFPSNNPNVQRFPSSNPDYQGFGNNPHNPGNSGFPFFQFPFQGNIFPNNNFF